MVGLKSNTTLLRFFLVLNLQNEKFFSEKIFLICGVINAFDNAIALDWVFCYTRQTFPRKIVNK